MTTTATATAKTPESKFRQRTLFKRDTDELIDEAIEDSEIEIAQMGNAINELGNHFKILTKHVEGKDRTNALDSIARISTEISTFSTKFAKQVSA